MTSSYLWLGFLLNVIAAFGLGWLWEHCFTALAKILCGCLSVLFTALAIYFMFAALFAAIGSLS